MLVLISSIWDCIQIDGNHVRVDRACPPRKKLKGEGQDTLLYDSKRTVFIGNLPFDVKVSTHLRALILVRL